MNTDKTWPKKHPILSTIIASVVGSLVFKEPRDLLRNLFSFFSEIIKKTFSFLASGITLPVWLVIFMAILSIVLICIVAYNILNKEQQTTRYNYTEDMINGIKWRWQWDFGRISGLTPFCPNCDLVLSYMEPWRWDSNPMTEFNCDHCSRTVGTIKGDYNYAIGFVKREIDRKQRNNLYKRPPHQTNS